MRDDSSHRLETIGDGEPDAGSLAGQTERAIRRAIALGDEPVPSGGADDPAVVAWLGAPGPGSAPGVSRWLTQVWRDRADLQEAFPGLFLDPEQRDRFLLWASAHAVGEYGAPETLRPAAPVGVSDIAPRELTVDDVGPLLHGITVVGYLEFILGIGAAGRAMARAALAAGVATRTLALDHPNQIHRLPWQDDREEHIAGPGLDTLLVCANGEQTGSVVSAVGLRRTVGRHRIGLWFWEADRLPPEQAEGLAHLDEVWVSSEFVAETIRAAAPAGFPVRVLPLGLDLPDPDTIDASARLDRGDLVLPPEGLLVGLAFDYNSRIIRKNPIGLIDAFTRAFPDPFTLGPERGPYLVFKTVNAEAHAADAATVRAAVGDRPDILLVDGAWDEAHQLAFTRELDVTASMHRSEGYGYALLEAMSQGKPTIATGWSGNLAFMNEANSWLVPVQTVPVPEGDPIYPPGAHWAEPDVDAAADALREVVAGLEDPDSPVGAEVRRRTEAARRQTAPIADCSLTAAWIRAYMEEHDPRSSEERGSTVGARADSGRLVARLRRLLRR